MYKYSQLFYGSITAEQSRRYVIPLTFQPTHVRVVNISLFDTASTTAATLRCDFVNEILGSASALTNFINSPFVPTTCAPNSQHLFEIVDFNGDPQTLGAGLTVYWTLEFIRVE
jgi:hypothetical protein